MPKAILGRLCLTITLLTTASLTFAQSVLLDHRTATYGNPWVGPPARVPGTNAHPEKTLVTAKALPAQGDFETLGALYVQSRWPGNTGKAKKLLAEQAKRMGANVVVEARVWQALAFPAVVAPNGSGLAVRINDADLLDSLTVSGSTWE